MGFQNTSRGQIARAQAAASRRSGGMATTGPDTIPGWVPPLAPAGQLQDRRITQTIAADSTAIPVAYGQVQVAGRVFAAHFDEDTSTWTVGALFCVGEVQSVSVLLNAETPPDGVTVNTYTGTTSQTADALLSAAISGYSDTLVYSHPSGALGICYAVIQYTNSVYPSFPQILGQIEGRKVYNPATETTGYTQVPALALRDLITSPHFGLGDGVNDTSVIAAADANTEDTDPVDGEQRRRIGLVLEQRRSTVDWVRVLATYAGCWAHKRGDTWVLVPDRPATTAAVLGVEDAQLDPPSLADAQQSPTVVRVIYTDKSESPWRDREAVAMLDGVSAGTVPRRESVVRLPGVDRYSQAKREAEERLRKLQRALLSGSGIVFDDSIGLELGDIIQISSHPLYPTHNLFRITEPPAITRPGRLRIRFSAYSADDYDDSKPAASWGANGSVIGRLADISDWKWIRGRFRPEDAARGDPVIYNGDMLVDEAGWEPWLLSDHVAVEATEHAYAGTHAIRKSPDSGASGEIRNRRVIPVEPGDAFIFHGRVYSPDDAIVIQWLAVHLDQDLGSTLGNSFMPLGGFGPGAAAYPGAATGYVDAWSVLVVPEIVGMRAIKFAVRFDSGTFGDEAFVDDIRGWRLPRAEEDDQEVLALNPRFRMNAYGWVSDAGEYPRVGPTSETRFELRNLMADDPGNGHNAHLRIKAGAHDDDSLINQKRFVATPGDKFFVRVSFLIPSAISSGSYQAGIRWYDSLGAFVSDTQYIFADAPDQSASANQRADAESAGGVLTAPAGAAFGSLILSAVGDPAGSAAYVFAANVADISGS